MMATSYNGWSASRKPSDIGILGTFQVNGVTFPAGVKSGAVAVVFQYLAEQYDARVEKLEAPGCWGYYFKNSANSAALISAHSSGTAVDFNAPKHPNGRRGTFTAAQVAQIRAILAELDGVVYWGGDAWGNGTIDEMHFEITTGTTEAQVRAVADRLGSTTQTTTTGDEDDMTPEEYTRIVGSIDKLQTAADDMQPRLAKVETDLTSTYTAVVERQDKMQTSIDDIWKKLNAIADKILGS